MKPSLSLARSQAEEQAMNKDNQSKPRETAQMIASKSTRIRTGIKAGGNGDRRS